jgi:hypothetical protein
MGIAPHTLVRLANDLIGVSLAALHRPDGPDSSGAKNGQTFRCFGANDV